MHHLRNLFDIMDRPQDIARMRACHQRSLLRQQRFQILGREHWGRGGVSRRGRSDWPPLDRVVMQFGEAYPGGNVGFVVEGGDDEFGAGGDVEDEG